MLQDQCAGSHDGAMHGSILSCTPSLRRKPVMTLEERIKERVANDEALRSRLAQCKDEEEAKKARS